jgi:thiamine monophosphate kinase
VESKNLQGTCWSGSGGRRGRGPARAASLRRAIRAAQWCCASGACGTEAAGILLGAVASEAAPACRAHNHPSRRLKHARKFPS